MKVSYLIFPLAILPLAVHAQESTPNTGERQIPSVYITTSGVDESGLAQVEVAFDGLQSPSTGLFRATHPESDASTRWRAEIQHPVTGEVIFDSLLRVESRPHGVRALTTVLADDLQSFVAIVMPDGTVAGHLSSGLNEWRLTGDAERMVWRPVPAIPFDEHDQVTLDDEERRDLESDEHDRSERMSPYANGTASSTSSRMLYDPVSGPYGVVGDPVVDIMVVYTQETVDDWNSLNTGNTESTLRAEITLAAEIHKTALAASQVAARSRLVRVEKIAWEEWVYNPSGANPNRVDLGPTLTQLRDKDDGVGDIVHELRTEWGADLVFFITPDGDNGGLAYVPTNPGPSTSESEAWSVIQAANWGNPADNGLNGEHWNSQITRSVAHEFGHLGGARHSRDQVYDHDGDENATPPVPPANQTPRVDYCSQFASPLNRFAFSYPVTTEPPLPSVQLCDTYGIGTLMESGVNGNQTVNGVTITPQNFRRIYRYSNPTAPYTFTCSNAAGTVGDGLVYTYPTGSHFTGADPDGDGTATGCSANVAGRLSTTLPAVANYRPEQSSLDGARLTSPSAGAYVSGTGTFTWNRLGSASEYWLEVVETRTETVVFDAAVTSLSSQISQSVSGLQASEPTMVRLWTNVAPASSSNDEWVFTEYRFNVGHDMLSCSDEMPGMVAAPGYDDVSCQVGGTSVCWYSASSDRFECDMSEAGYTGSTDPEAWMVSFDSAGTTMPYFASYGVVENGDEYCCILHDSTRTVDEVRFDGSSQDDQLHLTDDTVQSYLRPLNPDTWVYVRGYYGNDTLTGSTAQFIEHRERLYGYQDDDTIDGRNGGQFISTGPGDDNVTGGSGNDEIRDSGGFDYLYGDDGSDLLVAGADRDYVYGGPGNDTLISEEDNGDRLLGQDGNDVLCATEDSTWMFGSDSTNAGLDILYYSKNMGGSGSLPAYQNAGYAFCGHDDHSGRFTSSASCLVTLTAAPVNCANEGFPD